ncbi:MAG: nucleotidyl transferase AbiEii/AbiGii toxin family protein, partial [Acidimicrobiia bacterium]
EHDLSEANVQRDYVFGWLISGVYRSSALADSLVLKGGNGLRKGYFPHTRFSDDLDFTTEQGLDGERLLCELNGICEFAQASAGVMFEIDRNRIVGEQQIDRQKKVFKIRLYFKDFLTGADHITLSVRMDVTEYDRLYLPVQERQLIHPYSDVDECSTAIRCIKLEEALAEKMKCLLQRRYCYDLFDLVYGAFVTRDIEVDRSEMLNVFFRKTIFGASPVAAKNLLLDLPLDLFKGYWHKVVASRASRMTFDDAVQMLATNLEELFGAVPQRAHMAAAYFPSELRNPILQAGSEKRMLRVTYDGVTRIVEPYALAYKQRQDGVAQEYLYVWDRTGGRSSGPGIKTLLNGGIQSLELLEDTFEPRFEIGISKAGDAATAGTFEAQSRPRRSAYGPRRRATSNGPRYVIECTYCGKQFRRKTSSTRLNKHKDRYGNECYGRAGWIANYL